MMMPRTLPGVPPCRAGRERPVNSGLSASDSLCRRAAARTPGRAAAHPHPRFQGVSSSVDRHPHRSAGTRIVARGRSAVTGLRRTRRSGAAESEALLAAVPAAERVAVVDARFVGHVHALRLALTDPRFPASAVPGALTAQPEARAALAGLRGHHGTRARSGDRRRSLGPARCRRRFRRGTAERCGDPERGGDRGRPGNRSAAPDLPGLLADTLDSAGTPVHRPELGSLVATVPADPQARNEARRPSRPSTTRPYGCGRP